MLTAISWIALGLGLLSFLIILIDVIRHPQQMMVMNLVWPINGLFFGPLNLWAYYKWGRLKAKGIKKDDNRKWPAKVFVSTSHCSSGCAIGDIIGIPIVAITGMTIAGATIFADFTVEFILAYLFGIFFQFYAIYPMNKEKGVFQNFKDAIKADSLALIAFEVGMFGWMALVHFIIFAPNPPKPHEPSYWFMMQIALILGFFTSYPANWWLVKRGIKEEM
ncbi:DUF4396 domain-containing protein [Thalassobacillus devorans]|uniref:DUF4396 domain-containing protein n=1 Tax=Thalassobacillus devorans TaxID=279813 RepID=UPI00048D92EA|nr:DUF4396 domain-containing protein [Thalassobacillus devorans]